MLNKTFLLAMAGINLLTLLSQLFFNDGIKGLEEKLKQFMEDLASLPGDDKLDASPPLLIFVLGGFGLEILYYSLGMISFPNPILGAVGGVLVLVTMGLSIALILSIADVLPVSRLIEFLGRIRLAVWFPYLIGLEGAYALAIIYFLVLR